MTLFLGKLPNQTVSFCFTFSKHLTVNHTLVFLLIYFISLWVRKNSGLLPVPKWRYRDVTVYGLTKDAYGCIMGNVGQSIFGVCPKLGIKRHDMLGSFVSL